MVKLNKPPPISFTPRGQERSTSASALMARLSSWRRQSSRRLCVRACWFSACTQVIAVPADFVGREILEPLPSAVSRNIHYETDSIRGSHVAQQLPDLFCCRDLICVHSRHSLGHGKWRECLSNWRGNGSARIYSASWPNAVVRIHHFLFGKRVCGFQRQERCARIQAEGLRQCTACKSFLERFRFGWHTREQYRRPVPVRTTPPALRKIHTLWRWQYSLGDPWSRLPLGEGLSFFYEADAWLPGPSYSRSQPLNIGQHNFAIGPVGALTYLPDQGKVELSSRIQYILNRQNRDTLYQSGNELTVEYALMRSLSKRIAAGVNGFYYQQTTDDSLNGSSVGNRGRDFAIGPEVRFHLGPLSGFALKYQRDLLVRNRPRGNALWFQICLPLPGRREH